MGGIVRGAGVDFRTGEVGMRRDCAQRMCGDTFDGTSDLLRNIEDGLDSSSHKTSPIASVVFIPEPYAGENLHRPVEIRYGAGLVAVCVFVLAMQERRGARTR